MGLLCLKYIKLARDKHYKKLPSAIGYTPLCPCVALSRARLEDAPSHTINDVLRP